MNAQPNRVFFANLVLFKSNMRLLPHAILIGLLLFSCKGLPENIEQPLPETLTAEEAVEEAPLADPAPEEPPLPEEIPPLEAQPDFAESSSAPPETPLEEAIDDGSLAILPEPEEPPLSELFPPEDEGVGAEPLPELVLESPEEAEGAFPSDEAADQDAPGGESSSLAEEPPLPPEPPAFLRPSETETADAFREPVPVPVRPPAEAPARRPPSLPAEMTARPEAQQRTGRPDVLQVEPAAPAPSDEVTRSRTIRAYAGQTVEIPFRGNGWVFLGETGGKAGIAFLLRRNDAEGMVFSFRLEEAGDYELRFYRQDFIRDYIQNDHVRVIAEAVTSGAASSGETVTAPRWPGADTARETAAADEAPAGGGQNAPPEIPPVSRTAPAERSSVEGSAPAANAPAANRPPAARPPASSDEGVVRVTPPTLPQGETAETPGVLTQGALAQGALAPVQAARSLGADTPPEEFLRLAREALQTRRVADALSILDRSRDIYPLGSDEAWWLYGQALEAAGPGRDIKSALEYYRRLVQEYPQSPRHAEARRRIAYLERFYFNIP